MNDTSFRCFLVGKGAAGSVHGTIATRPLGDLPPGECLIRVEFSSLNYKDALAAQGHPGVVRKLPHVPGIDAAGSIVESTDSRFKAGDRVIVTGYELGAGQWGEEILISPQHLVQAAHAHVVNLTDRDQPPL